MTEKQFATWLIGHLFEIGPDGLKTPAVLAREVLEAARSVALPVRPEPPFRPWDSPLSFTTNGSAK